MPATSCPSKQQLADYLSGRASPQDIETIAVHIESCATCESFMASAEVDNDASLRELFDPVQDEVFESEPQLQRALDLTKARIGQIGDDEPNDQAASADRCVDRVSIGNYKIQARLGAGGMGTVYKAFQPHLERYVAIKTISPYRLKDEAVVARFRREIKAVGKLDHPNIVRAFDAGEENGEHYLVMEYVPGLDLSSLLKQTGPLSIADACELVRQTACGLEHAHRNHLVHRDIKPSNILLSSGGAVKLLDLGLARLRERQTAESLDAVSQSDSCSKDELTSIGQTMGTIDYMAPEQVDASHAVDIRADIYSLGVTLYKLLTSHVPFSGDDYDSPLSKIAGKTTKAAPSIDGRRQDLPIELAELIDRLLSILPSDRPATPAEVAAALEPFVDGCDLMGLAARTTPTAEVSATTVSNSISSRTEASREEVVVPKRSQESKKRGVHLSFDLWGIKLSLAIMLSLGMLIVGYGVFNLRRSPEVTIAEPREPVRAVGSSAISVDPTELLVAGSQPEVAPAAEPESGEADKTDAEKLDEVDKIVGLYDIRTWTDINGNTLDASYRGRTSKNVRLRVAFDDETIEVPMERLSSADIDFIETAKRPDMSSVAQRKREREFELEERAFAASRLRVQNRNSRPKTHTFGAPPSMSPKSLLPR